MKKAFFILLIISGCGVRHGVDGSEFLGEWAISKSSPGYSEANPTKIELKISKPDIFFWVDIKVGGVDAFGEITNEENEKQIKLLHQYQLSPDKKTLVPVSGMADFTILYHEDNNTIQNPWGWFEKK